jgi:hypothetical protein
MNNLNYNNKKDSSKDSMIKDIKIYKINIKINIKVIFNSNDIQNNQSTTIIKS